jgi:hypothetical protein
MVLVPVLALVMGSAWRFAVRPSLLRADMATTPPKLTLSGERIEQSSAATADFNGDGRKEIVIGGRDGMLYVIAYNGSSGSVVWSRQVATDLIAAGAPSSCAATSVSDIRSAPAIADLDNDGHLEIVVTTGGDPGRSGNPGTPHRNGGVLAYRYDSAWSFSVVSGWPQPKLDIVGLGPGASDPDGCWDGIWGSPALGDVDGDGDLEVAVEGFDRRLHVWHHNGTYMAGWPIQPPTISRGGWATPAIGDIDQDGLLEVVFGTDYKTSGSYNLYVFNGDASLLTGFPVKTTQNMMSSPALGDINGDGWLEIIVGGGSYEGSVQNYVYAWDHNGNLLSGWPKASGGKTPAPPALGDLDGDDDLEVVIGCGAEGDSFNPAPCTSLYAWHDNGNSVSGFPTSPANNTGWPANPNGLPYAPILADYDGDGSIEILVVNRWSWGISTVDHNGNNHNDSNLVTQNPLSSSPVVDDVDNDGKLEIIIGGATSDGSHGAVYIWDMDGNANGKLPWPTFHHDVRRTGRYMLPPKLGFPSEIRVFHQQGSGNTESQDVGVWNEGEGQFDWSIKHSITCLQAAPSSGTVESNAPVRFVITTTDLSTGWQLLGTVTITGTVGGKPIDGSPQDAPMYVYVGDVARIYLPVVLRNY